jgi:superfamily I DNA/RNA helicase
MENKKVFSKYQLAIFEEYDKTNNNIVVQASAGSGKSFVILELLKRTPKFKKTILVAFNKSIAEELSTKVPVNAEVKTVHGLAFSILRRNVARNFKVNAFKNFILGKKHLNLEKLPFKQRDGYLFSISRIIDLSRLNLCKSREDIEQVCNQYNLSILNGEIDDAVKMIEVLDNYNNGDHKDFMIDFTDMLYLCHTMVKSSDYPKYQVVMVDEAQDISGLQRAIIEKLIPPINGRGVFVGDDRQMIYSFLGADNQSFTYLKNRPKTTVLPLSVTYRCGRRIVDVANTIFPGLEAFENNPEGIVRRGSLYEVDTGDFVICRNNLPLIEAFLSIIKQGKKASILGKELGKELLTIIDKISDYSDYKEGINDILLTKEEKMKEKGIQNPKSTSAYAALVEKLTIIDVLKKEFGSFENMKRQVDQIFSDEERGGVTLCSGHKSKGLEADRVFFLQPSLIPSKYAFTKQELDAEQCLRYVIVTRAKRELIYVD